MLREAAIQLLLWRAGMRESLDILSAEEEHALHKFGREELEKSDWMFDIMTLRETKEKKVKKKAGTQEEPEKTPNGKRGRGRTQRR